MITKVTENKKIDYDWGTGVGKRLVEILSIAEHNRCIVRLFDKTKLSEKEIKRRAENTVRGLMRSYQSQKVESVTLYDDNTDLMFFYVEEAVKPESEGG